jgi:hypothetical protein
MKEGLEILRKLPENVVVEEWECLKGRKATELEKGVLAVVRKYDWDVVKGALEDWEGSKNMVFKSSNGYEFFIITGDDHEALLRNMETGEYVIARGLDWGRMAWQGGTYFGKEEFAIAIKVFMEQEQV